MEELAKRKEKHNHKWTNILKLAIFFTIMLAPFLAVLSKCMYVALNKNSKDSYYGENINEKYYENTNKITANHNYIWTYDNTNATTKIDYINIELFDGNSNETSITNWIQQNKNNVNALEITNSLIRLYNNSTELISYSYGTQYTRTFTLTFRALSNSVNNNILYLQEEIINKNSYLDNVFYYAVDDLQNQTLFNWAKQTGIYTTIETMTTGLGMNSTIAMLLAYWSICTAVYIVFDIIIFTFTKLTHFASD